MRGRSQYNPDIRVLLIEFAGMVTVTKQGMEGQPPLPNEKALQVPEPSD